MRTRDKADRSRGFAHNVQGDPCGEETLGGIPESPILAILVPPDIGFAAARRRLLEELGCPGKNTPFDPVAAHHAAKAKITVISAHGKNLVNIMSILSGDEYVGTTIHPDLE